MSRRTLAALVLFSSTCLSHEAYSDVFFRGSDHSFQASPLPGSGTEAQPVLTVTGATTISYGADWDLLISASGVVSPSLSIAGSLPSGIVASSAPGGIRLTGRTVDGVYGPFDVAVSHSGTSKTLKTGTVTVGAPEAQMALTPSASSPVFYPSQDWNLFFSASGGTGPYTFVSTTGLPQGVVAVASSPGATSLAVAGKAPAGTYPGITAKAVDAAGRMADSSSVTVTVVPSSASVTPVGVQTSDAVFSAVPQAPAATFQVLNPGPAPSGSVSVTMSSGASDFVLGGTCTTSGASVPAGQSCTVTLTRTSATTDDAGRSGSFAVSFANGGSGAGQVAGKATGYVPSVVLAAATLPAATVGTPWSFDFSTLATKNNLSAAGLDWTSANKPSWMSIARTTGIGSGTPTTVSAGSFDVLATNDRANGSRSYTISVGGALMQVTSISAGDYATCAVTTAGGIKCWGDNQSGKLGNGNTSATVFPVDTLPAGSGATFVEVSSSHACAIVSGAAKCWGYNYYGQLGRNNTTSSTTPVQVSGLTADVTAISVGSSHTCAVVSGAARCWGYNYYGQVGNNSTSDALSPQPVSNMTTGVTSISAGESYVCAVVSGSAKCWGYGANGRLGRNSTAHSSIPVQVSGLTSGVTAISAKAHSCAIVSGAAKCWGGNYYGQIGRGNNTDALVPTDVTGLSSNVTAITTGSGHTCAIVSGAANCWGRNAQGQLGTGNKTSSTTPVAVSTLASGTAAISAGGVHTCAMTQAGAQCWGYGLNGELGNQSSAESTVPIQVKQ